MKELGSADLWLPSSSIKMSRGSASDKISSPQNNYCLITLFYYSLTDHITYARWLSSLPFTDRAKNALHSQQAGLCLSSTEPGRVASPLVLVTERLRGEEYTSFRKQLAHNLRESKNRNMEEDNRVQKKETANSSLSSECLYVHQKNNSERCLFSFRFFLLTNP